MSWRRALLVGAGVGAALIAGAVLLLVLRLDAIVQGAIERRGSEITGTPVQVEEVEVHLASGHATLRGVSIANPPGFKTPDALTLNEVQVGLDLRSLLSGPLVLDAVRVVEPHVFYEVGADGTANIDVIRRNVEALRKAGKEKPPANATPGAKPRRRASDGGGRKLIIHLLQMTEGQVTIDAAATGGSARTESLPAFDLTAIGVKQGGASPAEVGRIILVALARDVGLAVAADELEKVVGKHLGGILGDVMKKGGSGAIGGGLGDVLDQILKRNH